MIYVSIPVHEQPVLVAQQLQNIAKFLPGARVVLHVAPVDGLSEDIGQAVSATGVKNFYINPVSVPSSWGGILGAHLENIRYIERLGEASIICFNASNDMFVCSGLERRLRKANALYDTFPLHSQLLNYWVYRDAADADTFLRELFGASPLIYSQFEGSCYPAEILFELARRCLRVDAGLAAKFPYEELVFASFANVMGVPSQGRPYVFSEVTQFNEMCWRAFSRVDRLVGRISLLRSIYRMCYSALWRTGFFRLKARHIYEVRSSGDGESNDNTAKAKTAGTYAVKRVPRTLGNPLRNLITGLSS